MLRTYCNGTVLPASSSSVQPVESIFHPDFQEMGASNTFGIGHTLFPKTLLAWPIPHNAAIIYSFGVKAFCHLKHKSRNGKTVKLMALLNLV